MSPHQLFGSNDAPEVYVGHYPELVKEDPQVVSGPHHAWWTKDDGSATTARHKPRVWGLPFAGFLVVFGIIVTILVGGAVGGGVGGVLTAQNNQKLAAVQDQLASAQSSVSVAYAQGFQDGQGAPTPTGPAAASITGAPSPTSTHMITITEEGGATLTIASSYAAMTPVSNCADVNGTDFVGGATKYRYTRICRTVVKEGTVKPLYQGVVTSFTECIKLCDSYNAWQHSNSSNVASFNFNGKSASIGTCWCKKATAMQYSIKADNSYDSAYLSSTFDRAAWGLPLA